MIQEIILTLILTIFFYLCFFENKFKPDKKFSIVEARNFLKTISLYQILILFFLPLILIILYLYLIGVRNFLTIYLYTGISILILLHSYWLFPNIKKPYSYFLIILFVFIIISRAIIPSEVIQNLFVILAISWLGPAINSFKFFSKKVFIFISVLWFAYDIFYVWLSSGVQTISTETSQAGLTLFLSIGGAGIGFADLFYASLLISVLNNIKTNILSIILLLTSYLGLILYAYLLNPIIVFPLLVLWVPIGIICLLVEKKIEKGLE